MRIGELLDRRRQSWNRLDELCIAFESSRKRPKDGKVIAEFASLYRSACSDLAMADAYKLPSSTVEFLHRLVGRAHNQLYRPEPLNVDRLLRVAFVDTPQRVFSDWCVHVCSLLFFGLFLISAICSFWESRFPNFTESIIGRPTMVQLEEMYAEPLSANFDHYVTAAASYINHNTGIGLTCFGTGPTIIWPLCTLGFNAVQLGTSFGFMARQDNESGNHFFEFVTAHGPFELSALALSAAAGLRLGVGLIITAGLRRKDSMFRQARASLPLIFCSGTLFVLAAFTEGFISPSPLPYLFKVCWAIASSGGMMFYFVILGFPRTDGPSIMESDLAI
jgi:uncharacterized membrane protein SpoIIM required for sporulation